MGRSTIAACAALALASCKPAPVGELGVSDAWVRLAAVPGRPAAAYFTVDAGPQAVRLVAIESPVVANVELHAGGMHDGMMTMRKLDGVDVPARGQALFAPGGNHAMLFGVDPSVAPGKAVPLTLRFADGRTLDAQAQAVAAGDDAPRPR